MTSGPSRQLGSLIPPAIATLIGVAILVALGIWQLERKGWKEGLLAQIAARAYGMPGAPVAEQAWPGWRPEDDEFRRVRVVGEYIASAIVPIHGLAELQRGSATQGSYLFEPMRLSDGSVIVINRGFVPTEQRAETIATLQAMPSGVDGPFARSAMAASMTGAASAGPPPRTRRAARIGRRS